MFITIIASSFNAILWTKIGTYPFGLNLYPAFAFSRAVYNCTVACGDQKCYTTLDMVHDETWQAILALYGTAILYTAMGTYFHETIQQEYGIRKSFFFCCDWCKRKSSLVNIQEQGQSQHQIDPEEEDDDCAAVR
jgi:hypothetical protein